MDWQPIETAPEMETVLLYAPGLVHVGHFNTTNNKWWTYTNGEGTISEVNLNSWAKPTHWMPLPEPPSQ